MFRFLLFVFVSVIFLNASALTEAFKEAKENKKLILVEISKKNCPYCIALDREVFQNPKLLQKITQNYVIVKLQREKDEIPSFLQVKFYPTTYLLKSDGTIVDEIPGYIKSSDFLEFIEEVYRQEKKFL